MTHPHPHPRRRKDVLGKVAVGNRACGLVLRSVVRCRHAGAAPGGDEVLVVLTGRLSEGTSTPPEMCSPTPSAWVRGGRRRASSPIEQIRCLRRIRNNLAPQRHGDIEATAARSNQIRVAMKRQNKVTCIPPVSNILHVIMLTMYQN